MKYSVMGDDLPYARKTLREAAKCMSESWSKPHRSKVAKSLREEARAKLQELLAMNPHDIVVQWCLSLTEMKLALAGGDGEKANKVFREAIKKRDLQDEELEKARKNELQGTSIMVRVGQETVGPLINAPEAVPPPWKALMDRKSGVRYYWNPTTNITQYRKPSSSSASSKQPSVHYQMPLTTSSYQTPRQIAPVAQQQFPGFQIPYYQGPQMGQRPYVGFQIITHPQGPQSPSVHYQMPLTTSSYQTPRQIAPVAQQQFPGFQIPYYQGPQMGQRPYVGFQIITHPQGPQSSQSQPFSHPQGPQNLQQLPSGPLQLFLCRQLTHGLSGAHWTCGSQFMGDPMYNMEGAYPGYPIIANYGTHNGAGIGTGPVGLTGAESCSTSNAGVNSLAILERSTMPGVRDIES